MATITSTSSNQNLTGTASDDVYVFPASFGLDTISDSGGVDTLDLTAVTSAMTINLTASTGNEVIYNSSNRVNWTGDIIENVLSGTGNDLIYGNTGNNSLNGGSGSDTINAGTGNDTLVGGFGNDVLNGEAGDDTYVFSGSFASDTISSDGSGTDTLDFSAYSTNLSINLSASSLTLSGFSASLNWTGVILENVVGGTTNDQLFGNTANNSLFGNTGSDQLYSDAGNDTLNGGDGGDFYIFSGAWGADTLIDASGTDRLEITSSGSVTINLVSGAGNEVTDGTNTINWAGDVIENFIASGSGSLIVDGSSAANSLTTHSGNDVIRGQGGNDTITAATGNDTLDGGTGDDTYSFANGWGNDSISGDASGTDNINLLLVSSGLTINFTVGTGDEITDGTNTINFAGSFIELIHGGSGNDTIFGQAGTADTLSGGTGDDTYMFVGAWGADSILDTSGRDLIMFTSVATGITINFNSGTGHEVQNGTNTINWSANIIDNVRGGSGSDLIYGNAEGNYLTMGTGNDTIYGGAGSDAYDFKAAWGNDTVIDSSGANDHVILSSLATALVINLNSGTGHEITDGTNRVNWAGSVIEKVDSGSGNDLIYGNAASNMITAGGGNDTIHGGSGNDIYVFANGWGADTLVDSAGTGDSLNLRSVSQNLTINLNSSAGHEVTDGTNTVNWAGSVIEHAYGGSGRNHIIGTAGDNIIFGAGGNDTLEGRVGNDTYEFTNSWGVDTIIDTGGLDTLDFRGATQALTINLATGTATYSSHSVNWQNNIIEKVLGGSGSDFIFGTNGDDYFNGGKGMDVIYGGAGDDIYVYGMSSGADTIDDASGTNDRLSLRDFNLSQSVFLAYDYDVNGNVDHLEVYVTSGVIFIKNYFANTAATVSTSAAGYGLIEHMIFADDNDVDFNQVRALAYPPGSTLPV